MCDKDGELAKYEPVMTIDEVAEVLRMSEVHVAKLMREKKFPGFKVYGSWRVKRADVQAVMDGTWRPEGTPKAEDQSTPEGEPTPT